MNWLAVMLDSNRRNVRFTRTRAIVVNIAAAIGSNQAGNTLFLWTREKPAGVFPPRLLSGVVVGLCAEEKTSFQPADERAIL